MIGRSVAAVCVIDETSGKIALSDAFSVWAHMPRKNLRTGLEDLTGKPCFTDDPEHPSALSAGAFPLLGAEAACLCSFHLGRLRTIEFQWAGGTAAEQRARCFRFIGEQDPCPETMQSVIARYPFGTVWISTDFRSGGAALRVAYAAKE